jgi:hypothetical protein
MQINEQTIVLPKVARFNCSGIEYNTLVQHRENTNERGTTSQAFDEDNICFWHWVYNHDFA